MNSCVIKNKKYKDVQELTGMSDRSLMPVAATHLDLYDRMPEVDEIYGADTLSKMLSDFDAKPYVEGKAYYKHGDGYDVVVESKRANNTYRDYETTFHDTGTHTIITPVKRPEIDYNEPMIDVEMDNSPEKNFQVLDTIVDKMNRVYGMDITLVNSDNMPDLPFDASTKNAFVYNGGIYINTDNAKIDAPLHEMMHLVIGELKYNDPELYYDMVANAKEMPSWEYRRKHDLRDMTESDAMEEVFITEMARHLAGLDSSIKNLPMSIRSKIGYDINRMIDSMVFGMRSVKSLRPYDVNNASLLDLCSTLGSILANNKGMKMEQYATQHRILANLKTQLIREGKLKEEC